MKDMEYWKQYFNRKVEAIQSNSGISAHNKVLLVEFLENKRSEGVGLRRIIRISEILARYAEDIGKALDEVTESELRPYIKDLEDSSLSESTKYTYKVIIRDYYRHLNEGELPKLCRFMNMSTKKFNRKLPDDIWTEEEICRMINCTRDPFWRAFISVGYESGARLGELLNMKLKDVRFNEFGAKIRLDGKTGPREIPLIKCIPHLATYVKLHPDSENLEAWLWVRTNGKKIGYQGIRHQLKEFAKRCNIPKKSNPHLMFRHSKATQMANHLTESQMKHYFGWTQDSKMISTYVHLSGRDIDNAILKVNGLAQKEEKGSSIGLPVACSRCNASNEPNTRFCCNCGLPLDTKTAMEEEAQSRILDEVSTRALKKESLRNEFKEAIRELMREEPKLFREILSVD